MIASICREMRVRGFCLIFLLLVQVVKFLNLYTLLAQFTELVFLKFSDTGKSPVHAEHNRSQKSTFSTGWAHICLGNYCLNMNESYMGYEPSHCRVGTIAGISDNQQKSIKFVLI